MKLTINLIVILIGVVSLGNAQGINFEHSKSWEEILNKAKSENKYILMDTYTTWCGPCKKMSAETFPKKEVGDFVNDKFISVKVQMDQTKEDDEFVKSWYADAKSIDRQYKITGYPTILFFSPDGKLVGRSIGYKNVSELIIEARQAIDNSEEFETLYELYKGGKRDSAFVKRVVLIGRKIGQNEIAEKISQQYIGTLNDREFFKKDNLQFVNQFTTSSNSKGFKLFKRESKRVNAVLGNNAAERKLRDIIVKEEIDPFTKDKANIPNWKMIEDIVHNKYGSLGLETYYGERMVYASDNNDWINFGKYYTLYYTTAYSRSKFHINNISWTIFESVSDPKVIDIAIKTMKYDIEYFDQKSVQAFDTYANLLYKAGKRQEAIKWEEKAVQIENENAAKGNGKPDPVFAETLEKMNKGIPTWPLAEPRK